MFVINVINLNIFDLINLDLDLDLDLDLILFLKILIRKNFFINRRPLLFGPN